MKYKACLLFLLALSACRSAGPGRAGFRQVAAFPIASAGGWDYLDPDGRRLIVSHGSQVNVLDARTGDSLGVVKNTPGVHGIAFLATSNRGFTSCGRTNEVVAFDLKTLAETGRWAAGKNPDFICI